MIEEKTNALLHVTCFHNVNLKTRVLGRRGHDKRERLFRCLVFSSAASTSTTELTLGSLS